MFAALATVVVCLARDGLRRGGKSWYAERLPSIDERILRRLSWLLGTLKYFLGWGARY